LRPRAHRRASGREKACPARGYATFDRRFRHSVGIKNDPFRPTLLLCRDKITATAPRKVEQRFPSVENLLTVARVAYVAFFLRL
jgi:hypothetical protein